MKWRVTPLIFRFLTALLAALNAHLIAGRAVLDSVAMVVQESPHARWICVHDGGLQIADHRGVHFLSHHASADEFIAVALRTADKRKTYRF